MSSSLHKYHVDALRVALDAFEYATDEAAVERMQMIRDRDKRIREQRRELARLNRTRPECNRELQAAWNAVEGQRKDVRATIQREAEAMRENEIAAWQRVAYHFASMAGVSERDVRVMALREAVNPTR